jgi:hypothetical protein
MPRATTLPAVSLLAVLAVSACAAPTVRLGPDADPRAARRLLEEAAATGPVRLEVNGPPRAADGALTVPEIAEQAARGVRGLAVRFADVPGTAAGSARLLLLFDPPPAAEGPLRLQAVFCAGGAALADATATTEGRTRADAERLIWRTTGRLFPDDYPDTYGFDLFGRRAGVGGTSGY